jgi:hypothetical protein
VFGDLFFRDTCNLTTSFEDPEKCPPLSPFNFSSSTLNTINSSFTIAGARGLEAVILPNLTTVYWDLQLSGLPDILHLDFTNLTTLRTIYLDLPSLKTIDMNGLQSFTPRVGFFGNPISFDDVGDIESVDAFFKNPISLPLRDGELISVTLNGSAMRNVKEVTLGWERIDSLYISGNVNLTFGGPDTSSMNITNIWLQAGSNGNLERSSKLENLTVGTVGGDPVESPQSPDYEILSLPFHQLSHLELSEWKYLRSIELPPEAEDWKNFGFFVHNCDRLNLTSEYNADNKKTWYWPKYSMSQVFIFGNVSTAFL